MTLLGLILSWLQPNNGSRPPAFLVTLAAAVAVACLIPVAYLVVRSAGVGSGWLDLVWRPSTAIIFGRTFLLMVLVTMISATIAVPIGWITVRSNIPLRRVLSVASVLPLVMPSFVMATTVIEMYSPNGILQGWLTGLGVDRLPEIYGLGGATLVLVLMTYPYVLLTVRGALRRMDPALEEAARVMGYGPVHTFWVVTFALASINST